MCVCTFERAPCIVLLSDCSCGYHVDSNGYGMCKKQYPSLNNRLACYVNKPSTCSDLQLISSAPDLHLSSEACQAIEGI